MRNGFQISEDGSKHWYLNDRHHRIDGPAFETADGLTKAWYINNILHREDGPAVEWFNGRKEWFYYGQQINCQSQEEFEKILKLKAFW